MGRCSKKMSEMERTDKRNLKFPGLFQFLTPLLYASEKWMFERCTILIISIPLCPEVHISDFFRARIRGD